jgi:hypothetical protein
MKPESYTNFFKDRLREELDTKSMCYLTTLAALVSKCSAIEKHLKVDPSTLSGQFSYQEWTTASLILCLHNYETWGDHSQARAINGDWELYFNGYIQKCQSCHNYAFRNDINYPKGEQTNIWTCTECKTDFTWPKKEN